MDCHSPSSQIIDTKNTANHIPSHVIKDKDLPYRITIFVQDGGRIRDGAVGGLIDRGFLRVLYVMIQVQDLLKGSYDIVSTIQIYL